MSVTTGCLAGFVGIGAAVNGNRNRLGPPGVGGFGVCLFFFSRFSGALGTRCSDSVWRKGFPVLLFFSGFFAVRVFKYLVLGS